MINTTLISLLFFLGISLSSASTMELHLLSEENLNSDFTYLKELTDSVGQVEFTIRGSRDRFYQSGFFIRENLVMTAYPTTAEDDSIDCSRLSISVAQVWNSYKKTKYNCEKILEYNSEYGFLIFTTKQKNSFYWLENISDSFSFIREGAFFTIGRSYQDFAFYSTNCWADFYSCPDCDEFEIAAQAWMGGRCLHLRQMIGSPVFSRTTPNFEVVGIVGMLDLPLNPSNPNVNSELHLVSASQIKSVSKVLPVLDEPPPTCTIEFEPPRIKQGESSAVKVSAHGTFLNIVFEGKEYTSSPVVKTVNPLKDTVYNAQVSSYSGSNTCTGTLPVEKVPAPTCTISVQPRKIIQGENAKITINVNGQFNKITLDGRTGTATPFVIEVNPWTTTTYNAEVEGYGGKNTCSTRLEVEKDPDFDKKLIPYRDKKCNKKGNCIYIKKTSGNEGAAYYKASGSSEVRVYGLNNATHAFVDINENDEWVFVSSTSVVTGKTTDYRRERTLSTTIYAGAAAINDNGYWIATAEKFVWGAKRGAGLVSLHTFPIAKNMKTAGVRMDTSNRWFVRIKDEQGKKYETSGKF